MSRSVPRRKPITKFEAIYRDHFGFVCGIARKLGGPQLEVDDVAQEVFLIAARRLDSFDSRTAQLTTWLYGITFNVVRGLRRRARSRICEQPIDDETFEAAEPETIDQTRVVDAWRIAADVFRQMSPAKREAYYLAELAGLSCAEIGALVGAREETIWSRLHYARREFRALLARHSGEPEYGAAA
jgi:RNA polymerase sigma-70 factor (ECF subfamily)